MLRLLLVLFLAFTAIASAQQSRSTLYMEGRYLKTPCGDTIILRGVNKMNIWSGTTFGVEVMPEIRKTGANVLRIVWLTDVSDANGSPANLDKVITACIENKMIPMIELHDATGDFSMLKRVADYWVRTDVVAILKKHERYLLINIANEAGDFTVSDATFKAYYTEIVSKMRATGVRAPLVIDAPSWGQNIDAILHTAFDLITADPEKNLLFSLHAYWDPRYYPSPLELFARKLDTSVMLGIPLIIGEFTGCYADDPNSDDPMWTAILPECAKHNVGWLAWEWGPGNAKYDVNPPVPYYKMDITSDGKASSIKNGWAKESMMTNVYSIQNTSVTTDYILNGGKCITNAVDENTIVSIASPNPVRDILTISVASGTRISIIDAIASVVFKTLVERGAERLEVQCAGYPSGVYRVMQERSGIVSYEQLVVVH
ncbi:MAG: cellulase family glycosylhydrolase [Ignavibacteria bacterium]|nr:cellulase family glycosylhydrolase [Ignavibacteria bacterium]